MAKLSELRTAEEARAGDMQDLEYRREYERTKLANDVAIRVIQYRVKHGLSQSELARRLGMKQPNVARLESGDHEPTLGTLARLAEVLNQDFSVDVKRGRMRLRRSGGSAGGQPASKVAAAASAGSQRRRRPANKGPEVSTAR
jgi:transcriptional regulator with XRE-family HTH domain